MPFSTSTCVSPHLTCICVICQVAEACKGAGSGSVKLLEMDAGSKESVTAVAKAVEGKARRPPHTASLQSSDSRE